MKEIGEVTAQSLNDYDLVCLGSTCHDTDLAKPTKRLLEQTGDSSLSSSPVLSPSPRNIYGKLGVHSRTQAVARARALGILSSTGSRATPRQQNLAG